MSLSLTDEEVTTLRALLAQVKVAKGAKDGVPYLMLLGRLGVNTEWCCNQDLKGGNAALSVDSAGNPTFVVIEYGADALVPGTIPIVFDIRNLCTNPDHSSVIFDLSINQPHPVFFRLNGMNMVCDPVTRVLSVPLPYSQAVAAGKVNAYAQQKLGRALLGSEQQQILTQWPGPTYTDADLDAIELLIDTF